MKILLTDGAHTQTLAMVRHLKGHTVDVIYHKKCISGYSRFCNELIIGPPITDIMAYCGFMDELLKNGR